MKSIVKRIIVNQLELQLKQNYLTFYTLTTRS
jgi:hypothetical protein